VIAKPRPFDFSPTGAHAQPWAPLPAAPQALYEEVYTLALERERSEKQKQKLEQEEMQQEQKRHAADDGDDSRGGDEDEQEDGEGDDGDAATDGESTAAAPPARRGGEKRHVRIVAAEVGRSAESVGSIMSALLGPLGRSLTAKRQRSRAHSRTSAATGATSGVANGADDDGAAAGSLHHSFASFVSRRGKPRAASRAQSVVGRVHSSLVAAGRIASTGPLADAKKSRLAAVSSPDEGGGGAPTVVTSAAAGDSGSSSGNDAAGEEEEGCISPGLPRLGPAEDAAAGAASVSLDAPRVHEGGGGAGGRSLKPAAAGGKGAAHDPDGDVYDASTTPLIAASAFPNGGRSKGARRSSVEATGIDTRRSMTNSMISMRAGISKKALLQQV
jgi:hypothetical protein